MEGIYRPLPGVAQPHAVILAVKFRLEKFDSGGRLEKTRFKQKSLATVEDSMPSSALRQNLRDEKYIQTPLNID